MKMLNEQFLVRPLAETDGAGFFKLISENRERLEDFFAGTVSRNKTPEETSVFISDVIEKAKNRTYFPFVIADIESGAFAGFIDIKSIDWNVPKAELGYFIDRNFERKGIITNAVSIIIKHCFEELGFNKLFLRTHESNAASKTVAEKNGFEREGLIRRDYKTTRGVVVDLVYYGLLP
jgi:ribosomal-protein-serine acetyltransferase